MPPASLGAPGSAAPVSKALANMMDRKNLCFQGNFSQVVLVKCPCKNKDDAFLSKNVASKLSHSLLNLPLADGYGLDMDLTADGSL